MAFETSARGLIWRLGAAAPKPIELARSLASAFQMPRPDCGDTCNNMPSGGETQRAGIVEEQGMWSVARGSTIERDPDLRWSRDRLERLLASLIARSEVERYSNALPFVPHRK